MGSIRRRILRFFTQDGPGMDKAKPRHVVQREILERQRTREKAGAKRTRARTRRIVRRRAAAVLGEP